MCRTNADGLGPFRPLCLVSAKADALCLRHRGSITELRTGMPAYAASAGNAWPWRRRNLGTRTDFIVEGVDKLTDSRPAWSLCYRASG